ncbi:TatD family hydrolase [Actinocatenispora rupis]|uniref:AraC family transcriptional regulator n=1 Tax=Actinocatenispora rupis TaxID=519421 RepID=A0A8J3N8P6_9ACTN|nr:TatD family hydrolase [Actinocatenispora rupis]GID10311.1 AraC family transcriptional regulator [Actinocatenispora rupis]
MAGHSHGRRGDPPPAPEPLPVAVADAHTHLYIAAPDDPAGALAAARAVGVDRVVEVGCDVPSSRAAVALAEAYPGVLAAVAVHPNDAPDLPDLPAALAEIDALAARPRVRAVGETGLDRFRTGDAGRAAQEESFRAHIAIAKRHGKPLMIHDRDAHDDIFRVLESEGAPDTVVFHCFSGDATMARHCADRGWYASFAGNVTFKNAAELRAAAAVLPAELLLVETDAPYLTPMPYRGRPNAPYLVPLTVRALAEVRGVAVDELCGALSANAGRVFGTW